MTPSTQLSVVRELLTAASAALITYGVGTDALWHEVTGGVVALLMLVWGIRSNTGTEQWLSLARKTLSSVGGVLMVTGTVAPDKANVLIGVGSSLLAVIWSSFKLPAPKDEANPPS